MLTQEIKRWLSKLFGWWPWKKPPEREYAQVKSSWNKSAVQDSGFRLMGDGVTPHSGVAPLIVGQSESSQAGLSIIDEWPERIVQATPPFIEKIDPSQPPAQTPLPIDASSPAINSTPKPTESPFIAGQPSAPEQKLEFLQYLVKRGIVNEGFAEGQVPEQYQ